MKKRIFLLTLAGVSLISGCADDDASDIGTITGEYLLTQVVIPASTDFDEDNDSHTNLIDESGCFSTGKLTLNEDHTISYQYTAIVINEGTGAVSCANEPVYAGTWDPVEGTNGRIDITYQANGIDTTIRVTKSGNTVTWNNDDIFAEYPYRDENGNAEYRVGATRYVFTKE